ncbi:MAG: hypothetical protein QG616_1658 [Pseudomonadota bacterium]|nr:hypothetical protein [Pseudomonadota bacterium]MDQ5881827.1 hypothetical protein [Pseudomonadota bacterium]
MNHLQLTNHARARSQQRAIPEVVLESLLSMGKNLAPQKSWMPMDTPTCRRPIRYGGFRSFCFGVLRNNHLPGANRRTDRRYHYTPSITG